MLDRPFWRYSIQEWKQRLPPTNASLRYPEQRRTPYKARKTGRLIFATIEKHVAAQKTKKAAIARGFS